MNIFIWEYVSKLTYECHCGGGCIIIAKTLERAYVLAKQSEIRNLESDSLSCTYRLTSPATIQFGDFDEPEEKVIKFPDQGCC